MEHILQVQNLGKTYPKDKFVLDNISFNLPKGAIMGLVGENGSGKTTIINIILGIIRQHTGVVNIFGRPYHIDDMDMKAQLGVVFDTSYFPDSFTPKDIGKIFSRIYPTWDDGHFRTLLERYEIPMKGTVGKLSQGTKAMVAIVTALAQKPKLIVLDEPTSNIDPVRREEVLDLFQEFIAQGDGSILFSSHITSDLEKVADYMTIIHKGKLVATADKDHFLYGYGIVRCNKDTFHTLAKDYPDEILAYAQRDYQYRILVKDQRKIPTGAYVLENPMLDEIMYLLSRGQKLC